MNELAQPHLAAHEVEGRAGMVRTDADCLTPTTTAPGWDSRARGLTGCERAVFAVTSTPADCHPAEQILGIGWPTFTTSKGATMNANTTLVLALVPLLLTLMAVEYGVAHWMGRSVHGHRQTMNNLGVAVGQRALSSVLGLAPMLGYTWLEARVGMFTWDTGSVWQWGLAFLLVDLGFWFRHMAAHRVAFLWAIHAVHHQSQEYNYTAGIRLGWVQETILFAVPLAFMGLPIEMVLPFFAFSNVYQFVQHTELVGKLPVFDEFLLTPSNHRVHHAINPQYIDKNYGNVFLLWDRLFGTFEREEEPCVYGTLDGLPSYDPVENNLAPLRALWAKAAAMPTWTLALGALVMPPEWKATVKTGDPTPQRAIAPTTTRRQLATALVAVGLAASLWVTWLATSGGQPLAMVLTGATLMGLVGAGLLLDGRLVRPQSATLRGYAAAIVLTVAGASTNGPLALLGRRLQG